MYWYLAHPDELLIDLDDAMRPGYNGTPHIELYFRRRLREAIAAEKLQVRDVYLTRSFSDGHFQAIIKLLDSRITHNWKSSATQLPLYANIERLVWQFYLGSDLYRARADLMRAAKGIPYPSLLILPEKIPNFYREPDAECGCKDKHKLSSTCPVFIRYRGPDMVEMFGPLHKEPEKMVPLPLGRVPINLIMKIDK